MLLACMAFAALSLFLGWDGSIHALDGAHDSLRYIGMAETIVKGQWLGEYDHMTLIRLPVYPLLLALNSVAGWPLHIVQQSIYLLSIFLLVAALRTVNVERWRIAIVCALCAFHPIAFFPANFVATEALYTPAATSVLAGCLGVLGTAGRSSVQYGFWVVLLSVSSAVFWHTRPESVWILLFGAGCLGFLLWEFRGRLRHCWVRGSAALLMPCVLVLLVGNHLASLNEKYYSIRVTHELAEPNFVAVFRWLTRLAPESHRPYIAVTSEAMEAAYGVSPHFAMLKPYLSQQTDGRGWAKFGCEWMGICDELVSGWSMWAVRDAVASIGGYASASHASEFYGAVVREIRQACEQGELVCSSNPTGNLLAPPVRLADVPRILISSARMTALTLSFGDLADRLEDLSQVQVNEEIIARYERVTHDQGRHGSNYFGRFTRVQFTIYRMLQIAGGLVVLVMFAMGLAGGRRRLRVIWPGLTQQGWIVAACTLVFILSRIALISYVDAICFFAPIRYLMVIYPALMVLICLALPSLGSRQEID